MIVGFDDIRTKWKYAIVVTQFLVSVRTIYIRGMWIDNKSEIFAGAKYVSIYKDHYNYLRQVQHRKLR